MSPKHGKSGRIIMAGLLAISACSTPGSNGRPQSLAQLLRTQQRQEAQNAREADRQARLPQPVSTAFQGSLTPVNNLQAQVSGKTLYLQTPFIQNGQLIGVKVAPIYLAPSGQADSTNWSAKPWYVNGNALCISVGTQPSCMTAFSDATEQAFLLGPNNLLVQVGRITRGDQDNVRQAYQRAQQEQAAGQAAGAAILGMFLIAALTGGGGNSGDPGISDEQARQNKTTRMMEWSIERQKENRERERERSLD